ncbi:MAG: nucleotidyltransferase family protein [Anaerolineae bacterium]
MHDPISMLPMAEIAQFCQRWKIRELALFGSAVRDDFGPHSDFDILVDFDANAQWGLFEHIQMQRELEKLLRRRVDLVSKQAVERSSNWLRRQIILNSARTLFSETETAHAEG